MLHFIVFLDIPAGCHIELSVEWVRQFFEKREDKSRGFLRLCINLDTPIPSRLVKIQEDALKDAIIDQLLDPTFWLSKKLVIAFRGTPYAIILDENRLPIQ